MPDTASPTEAKAKATTNSSYHCGQKRYMHDRTFSKLKIHVGYILNIIRNYFPGRHVSGPPVLSPSSLVQSGSIMKMHGFPRKLGKPTENARIPKKNLGKSTKKCTDSEANLGKSTDNCIDFQEKSLNPQTMQGFPQKKPYPDNAWIPKKA